jgi:ribosomal protein S18 acetylase RimI-like enzyme
MKEISVAIRTAEVGDYPICLPLFTLLYHGDIGPNFRRTFEEYVTKEEGVILLAEQQHNLVGILVGSYHLDIDWEGRTARIDALIVDEAYRMRGIAKKLTQHYLALAAKKKCRVVKSRVNMKNVIARKFHENLGFSKTNTYEYIKDLP